MNYFNKFSFVCEFTLTAKRSLNSNDVQMLNSVSEQASSDAGSITIDSADLNGEELSGRYYLNSDLIEQDEQAYIDNMKRDLAMTLKSELTYIKITVLVAVTPTTLVKRDENEDTTVYFNPQNDKYLLVKRDRYIEGQYDSEAEAVQALSEM